MFQTKRSFQGRLLEAAFASRVTPFRFRAPANHLQTTNQTQINTWFRSHTHVRVTLTRQVRDSAAAVCAAEHLVGRTLCVVDLLGNYCAAAEALFYIFCSSFKQLLCVKVHVCSFKCVFMQLSCSKRICLFVFFNLRVVCLAKSM